MQPENQRRYVRLETSIGLNWSLLNSDDREQIASDFESRSRRTGLLSELSHRSELLAPRLRKINNENPDIASYLGFLETMIENLAMQLDTSIESQAFDYHESVSISAVGMEFSSSQRCEPGALIEIVVELHPSPFRIMVIGEVVRCESLPEADGNKGDSSESSKWHVAVDYVHIRDADQELLIRHLHRLQMEELQRSRDSRTRQHGSVNQRAA